MGRLVGLLPGGDERESQQQPTTENGPGEERNGTRPLFLTIVATRDHPAIGIDPFRASHSHCVRATPTHRAEVYSYALTDLLMTDVAAKSPLVPFLDLNAAYRPIRSEILAAIARVCDSQRFVGGPEVEAFERELAAYLAVPYAIGVSSGTDALLMALMALHIGPGDDVITSAYSFGAAAEAIVRVGARPVFVDIQSDTFNIDPDAVARAITPRTRAVIPVHLFGQAADLGPILETASSSGIAVVEDAAQAIGASYRGRRVGGLGRIGCFSFFPSKNLGAFGDGGLITCFDDALADRLRLLRNHGMTPKYHHRVVGGNFRLDALQAAILRVKLPHLQEWVAARRRNATRYLELFAKAGLEDIVGPPLEAPDREHVYNQFVVRVRDRDRLRAHLERHGIGTEIYYPVPLDQQECFISVGRSSVPGPNAAAASAHSLALPIYSGITEPQWAAVASAFRSWASS